MYKYLSAKKTKLFKAMTKQTNMTKKGLLPAIHLIVEDEEPMERKDLVEFNLWVCSMDAGQTSTKYKIHVKWFDDGSLYKLVLVHKKIEEIWQQNVVNDSDD